MSAAIMVEIDGATVPLSACAWSFRGPCGCAFGSMHATIFDQVIADEAAAWREFYCDERDRARLIRRQRNAGYTAVLMRRPASVDAMQARRCGKCGETA